MPRKRSKPIVLRSTKPSAGARAAYRNALYELLEQMNSEVIKAVLAEQGKPDALIEDAEKVKAPPKKGAKPKGGLARLAAYWVQRWKRLAPTIAAAFVERVEKDSTRSLEAAFKASGFTVRMDAGRITPTVKKLIRENVTLISRFPEPYFKRIAHAVQDHLREGKDIARLEKTLSAITGASKRELKHLARDQSDKAHQAVYRAECAELGITEAIWVHVPGAKMSRATHMAMNGKRFRLDKGLYDSDVKQYVLPASEPLCRCTCRTVLPASFGRGNV